jgi:hypothetical protein
MKNCFVNLDSKINRSFSLIQNYKHTITEQQILELQDMFLSNGIHYMYVSSLQEGRNLIYRFLGALRCYNNAACATNSTDQLESTVCDLQKYLDSFHYFENKNIDELMRFLHEEFDFDFVWIEQNSTYWQGTKLEHALLNANLEQQLPIIVVSLKE